MNTSSSEKTLKLLHIIQLRLFLFWSLHFSNWVSSYRWILIVMLNKKVRFLCEKVWESERRQKKYLENEKAWEHEKEGKERMTENEREEKNFLSVLFLIRSRWQLLSKLLVRRLERIVRFCWSWCASSRYSRLFKELRRNIQTEREYLWERSANEDILCYNVIGIYIFPSFYFVYNIFNV